MDFLEPKVAVPRGAEDYTASIFSVDTKQVHVINHINLHKKACEMIYSNLTIFALDASKL